MGWLTQLERCVWLAIAIRASRWQMIGATSRAVESAQRRMAAMLRRDALDPGEDPMVLARRRARSVAVPLPGCGAGGPLPSSSHGMRHAHIHRDRRPASHWRGSRPNVAPRRDSTPAAPRPRPAALRREFLEGSCR